MLPLKTVMIVDDNSINRLILREILSSQYQVIETENGKDALDALKRKAGKIDAVMLDIIMPVMDGYDFLKIFNSEPDYRNIPVIVTTGSGDRESERKALRLGAWDFVAKPYDSDIILFRLKNVIDRGQLALFNQLKYLAEFDALTGIYNKSKFFEKTTHMIRAYTNVKFMFVRFDIDRFQLVNSFFGSEEGDLLLKHIAGNLRDYADEQKLCTYGRIEADVFGICMRYIDEESSVKAVRDIRKRLVDYDLRFGIIPTFGIYVVDDAELPVNLMYDRANLAAKNCKGNFVKFYAFYNSNMSDRLMKEQTIINEMDGALVNGQFCLYFQPKYDLRTKEPKGGEVLVRWLHPGQGLVTPGDFIPVFESNGFISNLDTYIWDKACSFLRKWIDSGKNPYPISVNVSRVDIYNPRLVDIIAGITDKYAIPHQLLNLEITESAYIDNPLVIKDTVKRLQCLGFIIMMDDFGSGYSSLNILKDIPVDVLKIDMKFLSNAEIPGRGENIIASVVRMAKWLNIPVVAEGVETAEQARFLSSIGCEYAQGYFFAKPMPSDEYECLIDGDSSFRPVIVEEVAFDADSIWASNSQMEALFGNVLQAVAIYELDGDNLEVLRVNNAFYELFGYDGMGSWDALGKVAEEQRANVLKAFHKAVDTGAATECEYVCRLQSGRRLWVKVHIKYIRSVGEKNVLVGSFMDVTTARRGGLDGKNHFKILIIDSSPMNRDMLASILSGKYQVVSAAALDEAATILSRECGSIGLVIIDMPEEDKKAFLEYKSLTPSICKIPVILVTSQDGPLQQFNTLASGAGDYIVKPFVSDIVLRRVGGIIDPGYDLKMGPDPQTGVYTKENAENLVNSMLMNSPDCMNAMIVVCIDNLMAVNKVYGAEYVDKILKNLANKLLTFFRRDDIVTRSGKDEFLIFARDIPSRMFIEGKADKLICEITDIAEFTCLAGVALSPDDGESFGALCMNARNKIAVKKDQ